LIIRGEGWELNTLEERAWRQESESVVIRNLFGDMEEIVLSASIIAKHSAVHDDAVGDRLLAKEMWNSRM